MVLIALAAGIALLAGARAADVPAWRPPLERPPIDPPLVLTSNFGEARGSHFHAGLDFSTGQAVGRPVYAPRAGHIVRVRASGAGYGRSLYLASEDGLLFVFGHLDAFEEPIASYAAAAQDSSGVYEQDLWPVVGRFPVGSGRRIAWTGESGAGPPHLHFEIRRGDMAYNPLRAGVVAADSVAPGIRWVTIEPLDDTSRVEGGPAPRRFAALRAETLAVSARGRLRVLVDAADARGDGVLAMAPWSVTIEGDGGFASCRFDSASWAGDMADAAIAYDRGRALGRLSRDALVMWAAAGHRARVFHTGAPDSLEAGVITVRPGDPPRFLRIEARDLAGHVRSRVLRLAADAAAPEGAAPVGEPKTAGAVRANFRFEPLPGSRLRMIATSAPRAAPGARGWLHAGGWTAARPGARGWTAVTRAIDTVTTTRLALEGPAGATGEVAWRGLGSEVRLVPVREGGVWRSGALTWRLRAADLFGPALIAEERGDTLAAAGEFAPLDGWVALHPEGLALRGAAWVGMAPPGGADLRGVGLYVGDGEGWNLVAAAFDSAARAFTGTTRRLGRFALLRDTIPPRVREPRALSHRRAVPYSRWAVEARVSEKGSGLDASASHLEIDGRRVPTEWDAERGVLRWRPLEPPARGAHRVVAVAADRSGNTARRSGRFVLE